MWLLAACSTRNVEKEAIEGTKVGHTFGYSLALICTLKTKPLQLKEKSGILANTLRAPQKLTNEHVSRCLLRAIPNCRFMGSYAPAIFWLEPVARQPAEILGSYWPRWLPGDRSRPRSGPAHDRPKQRFVVFTLQVLYGCFVCISQNV